MCMARDLSPIAHHQCRQQLFALVVNASDLGSKCHAVGQHVCLCHSLNAAGEHVGALAMSEPGAGSDVVGMCCRADYRDGKFVLNGTKMWCTNGTVASTLVVYAKTQPDKGPHGITAFLIEKGMKVCLMHITFLSRMVIGHVLSGAVALVHMARDCACQGVACAQRSNELPAHLEML